MKKTLLAIALLLTLSSGVFACPMCKDSVPNSDAESKADVPGGLNNSVYLLLGTFLAVLGGITGLIVKTARTTPVLPPKPNGFPIKKHDDQK